MLLPREVGWRRVHLLSPEALGLLDALRRPRRPPPGLSAERLASWVLDGILEIEHAGSMQCGPATHPLFFPARPPAGPGDLPSRLSREALRYAGSLGRSDPLTLTDRLYRYNSQPASPAWRRSFGDSRSVARLLQTDRKGRALKARRGKDAVLESPGGRGVWRVWEGSGGRSPEPGAPTFKLYLSPALEAVGEALPALLALFETRAGPFSAKVGRDLTNLLRPDKLVAYFSRRADLFAAATRLHRRLAGLPAQGVPFTTAFDPQGLLSWATDPPNDGEPPGPHRRSSWRGWITARLGAALASALATGVPVPPWQYALDRVSLDGVDPARWTRPEWCGPLEPPDADN